MRLAENENCLPMLRGEEHFEHPPDSLGMCSLPVTVSHRKTEFAQAAANTFQMLLDRYDSGNRLYQWILNFNYMTLGRFPEGVPLKYRIQTAFTDRFYGAAKELAQAEFPDLLLEDQAKQLRANTFHAGRGVAVEDFDDDGFLDLVVGVAASYRPDARGRQEEKTQGTCSPSARHKESARSDFDPELDNTPHGRWTLGTGNSKADNVVARATRAA